MIELRSHSPEDTRAIASGVASLARHGDLIVLAGQMGAGKTAFAQGFARGLGVCEPVTSPTYTLIHTYQVGGTTLHHADLYRLEHTTEVDDLALGELLEDAAVVLVEWGDVVDLGPHLLIELRLDDDGGGESAGVDAGDDAGVDAGTADDERTIYISSSDPRWSSRWERLEAAVEEWTPA